jgi:uncharacterized protein
MSGSLHAWYSLRELEALADRGGTLGGTVALGKLGRFTELLNSDVGEVQATLRFRHGGAGRLVAELDYRAEVELVCQRCLEPFRHSITGRVQMSLVDEDSPARASEEIERYELEEGRLRPSQLIEDELIVAMPLVPKHPRPEDCGSLARHLAGPSEGSTA